MASEQDDTVFGHDLDDDDDDEESSQSQDDDDDLENDDVIVGNDDVLADEEDEVDLNSVSPSTSSPATVPVAVPSSSVVTVAVPNGGDPPSASVESAPDSKRQRVETMRVIHQREEKKPQPQPQQMDESRRLFQRLWTDEDEIVVLQGFLDYTTQRGSSHYDTALFYDQIKSKLQLDFNKNQLVEKLRRLKKKYRNVLNKISSGKDFSFKSPHDQASFEISRKIWSSTGKIGVEDAPSGVKVDDKRVSSEANNDSNNTNNVINNNQNVSVLIEETVRSCLSPLFKELLSNFMAVGPCTGRGIGGLAMNAMPLSFGGGELMVDEKWRKQQILELEVYSKRLELVQDQIKAQLEELRSMGG
ncbi:hypothetical protein GH714_002768 [Hevea brasiliensis]|uniref:Glabrous enhancer-binding protein-like DBD domain-containing protein n=1 Tax=Hevea brasiliensis TaxID=3981 RepID=A0A6A6KFW6_HEVBR|nr:hypothetical protein GH714_002768 [Hevea brasiliensis]